MKKLILGWRGASFSKIVLDPAVVELFGRNQVSYQIRDKHPADIRDCVERLPDDTVVITFSAAALDCFKDTPENVYIMCGGVLKSLTELFDRDWLAQFSLGDLYSHGEFDLE